MSRNVGKKSVGLVQRESRSQRVEEKGCEREGEKRKEDKELRETGGGIIEKELKPAVSGRVVESVKLAADLSVNCLLKRDGDDRVSVGSVCNVQLMN